VASPLLDEAPTLDNGGLQQGPPFTVTFNISDAAVWEDGSPITSADFDFTWKAIMNTPGAYTTVGYDQIETIDTTDPKTAVITFKDVYVDWPDLFGGVYQGLFKAAAFPDADPEKPNLEAEMQSEFPFSGGPWILQSWSKDEAVLVKNENYYGPVAHLDKVTMVPRTDQATEINSLLTGEVAAIYPQPSDASLIEQVASNPNVEAVGSNGGYFEALWFNHESAPLDDPAVREAMMYAVDRQAVIDSIIKLNNPDAEVLACGFVSFPHIGQWCSQTYFGTDVFPYDPEQARSILEGAGYDCSAPGEACTKDGEPLVIEYSTVAGNTRRETTQQLLQPKALEAGIQFRIKNYEAGILFGDIGPKGQFTIADYATGGSVDPSITSSFACDSVPSEANAFAGGNWNRWCNEEATTLMRDSDKQLDPAARLDLLNQVYELEVQDFLSLPLYVLPNVGAWRTDQIAGPIDAYIPSNLGMFFNMNEWYIVEG
jgi:peptide/nickel transport system substrate-binding protein